MVSTIKLSAYICLKYVQLIRKTVTGFRNNNSKPIDIYHHQDGHNLVESPWKCFVFGQNNKKLRGLRAQSVHTIERWQNQIQEDVQYVGKLIYIGNEHNWLLHDESTTKHHKYWESYFPWQIISTIVPWFRIPDLKWYFIIWWSHYGGCRICWKKATT